MSYDHAMNATIIFNANITVNMAIEALAPLLKYWHWDAEAIASQFPLPGEDFVQINANGDIIQSMIIYTCGDVASQYHDTLVELGGNLLPIAKPGFLQLDNHSTPNLESAVEKIWYGEPSAVAEAKLTDAWDGAAIKLRDAGVADQTLTFIEQCLQQGAENASVVAAQKAARADDAELFFDELENEFLSLSDVGLQFGPDTVRDLFYLHSAILSGTFMEHFQNDSQLLEVVEQLPSRNKWMPSIHPRCG